jgi:hypothetical protein
MTAPAGTAADGSAVAAHDEDEVLWVAVPTRVAADQATGIP